MALGFGIGSPEAAAEAAAEADGVIIGSKLMRLVGEGGPEATYNWLREVREAMPGRSSDASRTERGTGIRNWLSKRREYSRTVPETESGVGPMDAVFTKCERCGQPIYEKDLRARFNVCPHCEFHYPLSAPERIRLLTDAGSFEEQRRGDEGAGHPRFRRLRGPPLGSAQERRASTTRS